MKYEVFFLPDAEDDIDDIEVYLSQFYEETVRSFVDELKAKVATLEDFPHKYQEYEEDPFFRKVLVNQYLLFYSVDDKRKQVIVHRIFHSLRDTSTQILGKRYLC
jgi:plasmid stabilization system protein ParE